MIKRSDEKHRFGAENNGLLQRNGKWPYVRLQEDSPGLLGIQVVHKEGWAVGK